MITLIDYGLGNIQAFVNVYKRLNIPVRVAKVADDLSEATKIILPGVGAFDHAMERLERSGMRPTLDELVLGQKMPILGICVGMQMLGESSDEGSRPGLGWVKARVKHFKSVITEGHLPLPHMGWNIVKPSLGSRLFTNLEPEPEFYFLHSYYFECRDPQDIAACTDYGLTFPCAIQHENICGVQFHPEKSHHFGTQLLKNYSEF